MVDHQQQIASAAVTQKPLSTTKLAEDQHQENSAPSKPIAIDLPKRHFRAVTPLSARGDLIGYVSSYISGALLIIITYAYIRGYFPFHETSQRSLETHPFNKPSSTKENYNYHSEMEMLTDSPLSTPAAVTEPSQHNSPYHHQYTSQTPQEAAHFSAMSSQIPETPPLISMPPLGKYHPANYQNKTTSISLKSPRRQPTSHSSSRPISPTYERGKSDIKGNKQLLQKYQRDMIEQATRGARRAGASIDNPGAPKLLPLGSPGPVTPMELEESSAAGYLVAGARGGSCYLQGENRKEADMVGRMIRAEEERRRREGQSSPLATAGGH